MIQKSMRSAFCRVPSHIPSQLAAPGERASAGLLVPARSLDGVGAQPLLLNPFALKPTIEAAEPGVSFSLLREPLLLLAECLFKEISNKNCGFDTQEPPGTWAFARVLSCYATRFTSSVQWLLQLLTYLKRQSDSPACRRVPRPAGEPFNVCDHEVVPLLFALDLTRAAARQRRTRRTYQGYCSAFISFPGLSALARAQFKAEQAREAKDGQLTGERCNMHNIATLNCQRDLPDWPHESTHEWCLSTTSRSLPLPNKASSIRSSSFRMIR